MNKQEDIDWLYEYMLQYITSATFNTVLKDFVEENCFVFSGGEENSFEHTELHNKFKKIIDNLLQMMLDDLGANEHQFILAAKKGLSDPESKRYFEQLIANENFIYFKNMMVKKNFELQEQAYSMFKENFAQNLGINMQQLEHLENNDAKLKQERQKQEEEEIKATLEMSMALDQVKKELEHKEEEELKKAIEMSKADSGSSKKDLDDELKQAIHMSLREKERNELKGKESKPEEKDISLYNNSSEDVKATSKLNPILPKSKKIEPPILEDNKLKHQPSSLVGEKLDDLSRSKVKETLTQELENSKKASEELQNQYNQFQNDKEKKLQEYRELLLKLNKEKRGLNQKQEVEVNNSESALSDEIKKKLSMRKDLANQLKK